MQKGLGHYNPVLNPLEMGSYFGRWCIEAVAAVKAFGLDDSLCLGHEHYPGDLLRPDGPSTHPQRPAPPSGLAGAAAGQAGWLSEFVRCSSRPRLAAGGRDSCCAGLQQAYEYRHRSVPRIKQQPR